MSTVDLAQPPQLTVGQLVERFFAIVIPPTEAPAVRFEDLEG